MGEYRGRHDGAGRAICLVVSQFNVMVTERLREGALEELRRHGVAPERVDVVYVPGAWELTGAARRVMRRQYDAVVVLGCIIRGETAHFDYLCRAVTDGLGRLQMEQDTPITFGVLTAENLPQALERSGGTVGNLGAQAALAALELCDLFDQLDGS